MTEITLASLAMDFNVASAAPAKQQTDALTASSRELEQQVRKTEGAIRSTASAHGAAGTSAGRAEQSLKGLVQVYGQARDGLGRFAKLDGDYRLSQEATILTTLQNAKAVAALAKEQAKAEAEVASLTKRYDSLRAELDPLAAIQTTLARRTDLLNDAMAKGVITADQHAAMLSKVTRAALAGVQGVDKYTGGLRNGGQHLTQFSFQLNDIVTGLISGQKPFQILAQQGGQVFQIFQQAAIEAGGFKAAIRGLMAEVAPLLAAFAPWIAGLAAVGAVTFLVIQRHKEHEKKIKDLTKSIDDFHKKIVDTAPTLNVLTNQTDLARIGTANFSEYLQKGREKMDGYADSVRKATIELWKKNVAEAQGRVDAAKALVRDNPKPADIFVNSMGKASQWANAPAIKLSKDAVAALNTATTDLTHAQSLLNEMQKAAAPAFAGTATQATRTAAAVREVTKATEEYTRTAAPIQEEQLLKATEEVWPYMAAVIQATEKRTRDLNTAQNDNIRTIADALPPAERLTRTIYELAYAYERAFQSAGDFATAIARGDFGGALNGASRTLQDVSDLLGPTSKLGSLLGSAGAALGPVGAAVSAVTSVLGVIGERSAAKAQARLDALAKGVENLRTDNKTSTGSIAGALAQANASWNADLEYSSAMVTSLRSIDNQIGALANALSRSITAGGLLSTSTLGLGKTGGGGLFGSSSNAELLDQGLAFNPTTYGQGVTGSTYADLATTKTKKFLGITTGVKVSNSTVNGAIDPSLLGQINGIIEALGNGVLSAASVFGVEAAKAAETALGSAVVDLGKLSLKDLKPDEIAAVLQATFDKVGDQLAAAGIPGLDKLATVGEGSFETLTRLAREYQVVDTSLAALGKTFGMVGVESLAARDNLVQLFGGLDAFTSATSFFASNFLTDAERLAPVLKAVNDNLAQFGLSATSTRDQFKDLVLGLDVSTEAGANAYKALLSIAPAFDKVATAAEDASQRAAEAAAQLAKDAEAAAAKAVEQQLQIDAYLQGQSEKALQAASDAQASYNTQLTGFADAATKAAHALDDTIKSLTDFADSLKSELGLGTTGGGLEQAKRAFNTAVSTGNYDAIPELGKAYADALKDGASSRTEYLQGIAAIRQASLNSATSAKSDAYQRSLSVELMGALFQGKGDLVSQLLKQKTAGLPGFANGGSFTFGGNPGVDQNVLSLNNQPIANVSYGETAFIGRGGASNDNSETAALRAEIAALRADLGAVLAKIADNTGSAAKTLKNVTPNGNALATEAAS